MEILAIIPARGSSKGIPNKNTRLFGGQPLIAHTIIQARQSKMISRVVVSTDSKTIAAVAKRFKAQVPFLRPAKLATDKSRVVDAVVHLLNKLKKDENYQPDYVILLQPTSPLRTVQDIDQAIKMLLVKKADGLVSVRETEQLLYTRDRRGFLHLVSSKKFLKSPNRQQLPPTYKLDGSMIYIMKTSSFLKQKTFLPKKVLGYMIPRWRAVDLDEAQDFVVGEMIYKNFFTLNKKIKDFK